MEKTIEIPEGYEARIEGNKVIIELKESEDERIRQAIESIIRVYGKTQGEWIAGYDMDTLVVHLRNAFDYLEKQKEQKPLSTEEPELNSIAFLEQMGYTCIPEGKTRHTEWSEEDEMRINHLIGFVEKYGLNYYASTDKVLSWLKSPRHQPKQESEPIEIKYAGKIYKVYGTKELSGGVIGYIIEDEPGHYDCIIHPDEVLGGGYGIKSNGSPYPTKEANFGQPHWKPSEEQMEYLAKGILILGEEGNSKTSAVLNELRNDLKNYFSHEIH